VAIVDSGPGAVDGGSSADQGPRPASRPHHEPPADGALDLMVAGDVVPDLVLGDISGEIKFGQADNIAEQGVLTVGGSSSIMACGAAQLGLRVAFVGVVGDDAAGRFMLEELAARGVDVSGCVVLPARATAVCVHLLRPGAERDRAMISWLGCDGELTAQMVRASLSRPARHFHVGSFYLLPKLAPDLANLFSDLRQLGCSTSLDPQGDPRGRWDGGLREVLRQTDFFFPNRNEAIAVAEKVGGQAQLSGEPLLRSLGALGPVPVVKCASEGAYALDGARVVHVKAPLIKPVDTIGAGDSFDAGFVYGHLQGWPVTKSLAFAVACGSLSGRRAGGVLGQARVEEAMALARDLG